MEAPFDMGAGALGILQDGSLGIDHDLAQLLFGDDAAAMGLGDLCDTTGADTDGVMTLGNPKKIIHLHGPTGHLAGEIAPLASAMEDTPEVLAIGEMIDFGGGCLALVAVNDLS